MPANPNDLGIGDIVMSPLSLADFRNAHGDNGNPSSWVLCDGSQVNNSVYHATYGANYVPDLMGRYPRCSDIDSGGADRGIIPLPPNQKQSGTTLPMDLVVPQPHAHGMNHNHALHPNAGNGWGVMPDAQGGGNNQVARIGYGGGISTEGPSSGSTDNTTLLPPAGWAGAEIRPYTTILNFYIRIN